MKFQQSAWFLLLCLILSVLGNKLPQVPFGCSVCGTCASNISCPIGLSCLSLNGTNCCCWAEPTPYSYQTEDLNSWTEVITPLVPTSRYGHVALAPKSNTMLIFGGYVAGKGISNDAWLYQDQSWTEVEMGEDPSARIYPAAVSFNEQVYIHGGVFQFLYLSDFWVWEDSLDTLSPNWKKIVAVGTPSARSSHAMFVSQDNMVILFGGVTEQSNYLGDTHAYSTTKKKWKKLEYQTQPGPRSNAFIATLDNKCTLLYGGYSETGSTYDDLWMFCNCTSGWEKVQQKPNHSSLDYGEEGQKYGKECDGECKEVLPTNQTMMLSLPGPRASGSSVAIGNDMYIYGGSNFDFNVWIFRWSTHTWSFFDNSTVNPGERLDAPAVTISNAYGTAIVMFGGNTRSSRIEADYPLWVFDLKTLEWSPMAPPLTPSPRRQLTAIAMQGLLIMFGGRTDVLVSDTLWGLSLQNVWYNLNVQSTGQNSSCWPVLFGHSASCTTDQSEMFVFGGKSPDEVTNDILMYTRKDNLWHTLFNGTQYSGNYSIPEPRLFHSSVFIGEDLYIFGGQIERVGYPPAVLNELWKWSNRTMTWTQLRSNSSDLVPVPRIFHSAVAVDHLMFVYGGKSAVSSIRGSVLNDTWIYDTTANSWFQVVTDTVPMPRFGHAHALVGNKWIIFWGQVSSQVIFWTPISFRMKSISCLMCGSLIPR